MKVNCTVETVGNDGFNVLVQNYENQNIVLNIRLSN